MKIRRFFENEQKDISTDRIDEILKELKEFTSTLDDRNKMIEALETELSTYKNQSIKSNDQIDDSIAALQIVKKNIDDNIDKLDTIVGNLISYSEDGRKYLYTENK